MWKYFCKTKHVELFAIKYFVCLTRHGDVVVFCSPFSSTASEFLTMHEISGLFGQCFIVRQ